MALNRGGTRFTSFTFHCHLQDHDPHEHGLDDHDTPRLIWQVDQLLPLTSDTDHQFYIFTCKTCKLVNCGLYINRNLHAIYTLCNFTHSV